MFLGRDEVGGPSGRPEGSYPQVEAELQPIPGVTGLRAELGEFVNVARRAGKIYRAAHA